MFCELLVYTTSAGLTVSIVGMANLRLLCQQQTEGHSDANCRRVSGHTAVRLASLSLVTIVTDPIHPRASWLPYIFHILLGFYVQVYLLSVLKFLEKSEASISVAEDVHKEVTNDRLKAGAKEEADSLNWPKNGHMGGATAEKRARLETEEPGSPRAHTTEDAFNIFGKSVAMKSDRRKARTCRKWPSCEYSRCH
ncbi:hypothetical protein JZ751_013749 [Albula glossodonta]|uniref:Uncharacterized protein n=1 Tax=Albula glossodonta TaxID=121402 RepID=A0A8T2NTP1_9TELE|nr:hypothetical protein JZ751_013749 [Albula glossodonta]